jgi:hypothetical protein
MLRRAVTIPRHSLLTQTLKSAMDGVYAAMTSIAIKPAS